MDFSDKSIAVVGFGVEGKSVAKFVTKHGGKVTVCDQNTDTNVESYDSQIGENYLDNLERFDLVFRSPSIRPELLKSAKSVTSATDLFIKHCPGVTIGVTGTKGKGTTSSLIKQLLTDQGINTYLGGNIGIPKLSFLDNLTDKDVAVLELSSFQLIDVKTSPEIAVCVMIEPDHLNWHIDMNEYIEAKANITKYQSPKDVFIYHPTNSNVARIAEKSPANKIKYMDMNSVYIENEQVIFRGEKIISTDEVGLIGKHNLENICAALTAIDNYAKRQNTLLDQQKMANTVRNFKGLEHRLEFVREIDGVKYFNDSFASAADAAIAGVNAFAQPVISIIGGVDKGGSSKLAEAAQRTKFAILIGEIAPKVAGLLDESGFVNYQITDGPMENIVEHARTQAEIGDVILLSPGTSSYDMFKNFKDRGEQFKKVVNSL